MEGTTPQNDNIESIIESNSFNAIIDHFNNKLTDNDTYNSSEHSDNYDSDDDEIILDNYLLNKSGENIADILTNINNNLISLVSILQNNNNTKKNKNK